MASRSIKDILNAHSLWLCSNRSDGERADFSGYAFFGDRLAGLDLTGANLNGAKLSRADLCATKFDEAELIGADLEGAILDDASLRRACLQNANLVAVEGLTSASLAGANLSGARLPEDIAKFAQLDHVTEISKHAHNIFVAAILACVFSWLVVATTTDAALLVNKTSTELPFVGAKIPIAGFYWAAPAIMLSLYIYLLLYMQRLWESLADLPAVFPDGRPLEKQAFPWMLTSIVRIGVRQLREHRLAYSGLRVLLSILTGWLFVPATIIILWVRFCRCTNG